MENLIVMSNVKPKSVIIDGEIHAQFKEYCNSKNLKIGKVVERLIEAYLSDNSGEIQKIIDEINNNR